MDARKETFEEIKIFGESAIYTPERISPDTIPDGYYKYEIKSTDSGDICGLLLKVWDNFWGTVILNTEIALDDNEELEIDDTDIEYYTGNCKTLAEYTEKYKAC